jgi:glutaminase
MTEGRSGLFAAFSKEKLVSRDSLLQAFSESGILEDDVRYRQLLKRLKAGPEELNEADFQSLQECSPALFEQVLSGQLAIPHFSDFCVDVENIFDKVSSIKDGKLADYIPQLQRVDPEKFAVSICSIDGQRMSLGDSDDSFCVQSCSKPITYCLALEEHGEEEVHRYVGAEPSGRTFNELALNAKGLPHNPMINAGAIMCGALIKAGSESADRFDYVISRWRDFAGGAKIGFDNAVYLSERQTADRNFALGYFMREKKAFPPDADLLDVLDFYFQCCSIEASTKSLAIIAATLANGGNCPLTGVQVMRPDHVKNCLSLMSSCGMYDFSGEFAFKVGIPAKSGVSGAILLVVPNVAGFAVWSPRLDELGNSVRGVEFSRRLVSRFKFHTFDSMVGLTDDRVDPRRNLYASRFGGITALCWAAYGDDVAEMRRLVALGIDPASHDYDHRTALHIAASEGKLNSLRYLLALGVNINPLDRWGKTPLDDADMQGHQGASSLLAEHGGKRQADPAKKNATK